MKTDSFVYQIKSYATRAELILLNPMAGKTTLNDPAELILLNHMAGKTTLNDLVERQTAWFVDNLEENMNINTHNADDTFFTWG